MSELTDNYCRTAISVARTLELPEGDQKQGAKVAWTASRGEGNGLCWANDGTSTLVMLEEGRQLNDAERAVARESLNYPHDKVGRNLDSMGMLQQRPSADWGPPSELMDPPTSFRKFFLGAGWNKGLLDKPGWASMPTWQAAWEVQQCSEDDIWVYQREADAANADVDRLWGESPPEPEPEAEDVGYLVYRFQNVDYVAAPERFRAIESVDDYHFMLSTGWIDVPHGEAPQIERNLLEYIRNEALRGALPGGVGEIIN